VSSLQLYGENTDAVRLAIKAVPRERLEDALLDIYAMLFCDESGEYAPEQSQASDSAADFVEKCDWVFQRVDSKV